jgi:tetratricopeptide (TPR) repeat protein
VSGDAEQQYLCDGLAEEIIIALSRIRALFVIARNSSFTYRGKEVDVRQIGRDALRKFRSAIALDPSFASPYGLASRCCNFRKAQGWMVDRMQKTAEAVGLARKALELAKDDVVALSEAGYALAYVGRDLDAAASALDRAIELNPSSANSWHYRGMVGVWLGETLRTIEYVSRAMRLSPVDPLMYEMKSNIAC